MRLLVLLWAMLASLGVALTGAVAARSPVEASVAVVDEAAVAIAAEAALPPNTASAAPLPHRHAVSWAMRPLYLDRRRE